MFGSLKPRTCLTRQASASFNLLFFILWSSLNNTQSGPVYLQRPCHGQIAPDSTLPEHFLTLLQAVWLLAREESAANQKCACTSRPCTLMASMTDCSRGSKYRDFLFLFYLSTNLCLFSISLLEVMFHKKILILQMHLKMLALNIGVIFSQTSPVFRTDPNF